MELKIADKILGEDLLCTIRDNLNRIFGPKVWAEYDLETISLELGIVMDELLRDKITLLQILEQDHELFYNDVLFFLHASEVINNKIADFEALPFPSSLEIAYAIFKIGKLYPDEFAYSVKKAITYILKDEGYSKPVGIFKNIAFTDELEAGQEKSDSSDKARAIEEYIKGMDHNDY